MTRKWGRCWPRANGFNGRIQGNKKSRASNHSLSDSRSSVFSQTNQDLQSPVRCPPVPGLRSPVPLFDPVSGRQPPPVWPRPLRPGPTRDSFWVPLSSTEPPSGQDETSPVSRPPIRSLVRLPSTCGLAPSSPGRLHPRIVFGPIIVDRAPESEPGDVT